ncbi:hypothetical protein HaLaN_19406 [Haematococcus lacustris]|uniref:Uncharacterized protein n=1 Tax=Haematococcus lacustris TaxID=44745 RepID=A0A699ZUM7_HAELA|nr:hypothetical protein HaLaN_19406 [Haematococcus lacustris]
MEALVRDKGAALLVLEAPLAVEAKLAAAFSGAVSDALISPQCYLKVVQAPGLAVYVPAAQAAGLRLNALLLGHTAKEMGRCCALLLGTLPGCPHRDVQQQWSQAPLSLAAVWQPPAGSATRCGGPY